MKIRNFIVIGVACFQLNFAIGAHETENDVVNVTKRPSSYLVPVSIIYALLSTITGSDDEPNFQISSNLGVSRMGESTFLQNNDIPTNAANNFFSIAFGREAKGYDLVLFKRNAIEYLQDMANTDDDNGSSFKALLYNGSFLAKDGWCYMYIDTGLGVGWLDLRSQADSYEGLAETGLVAQFRIGLNFPLTKTRKSMANLGYRNIVFIGDINNVVFHRVEGGFSHAW